MSLQVKKGSFAFPDSSANLAITGVGFQPRVVLFWLTRQSAVGYSTDRSLGFGWGVSSTERGCLSTFATDNVGVSTATGMGIFNQFCINAVTCTASAVTTTVSADFISMDSDGFTIDPITVSAGALYIVHYMAIGGSDVTDAWAGVISGPTTASSVAYTGVGFQPDCLMFLTNATGTLPRNDVGTKLNLGVYDGTTQAVSYVHNQNAINTSLMSYQSTGAVIRTLNFAGTDNTTAAVSAVGADGFTLNYTVAPATARDVLVLALKGGNYKVVTDTQKTSTGTQAKTGVGFLPTGLLMFGTNRASSASVDTALASMSVGASDGTTEGTSWAGGADNVATTDENSATQTTKALMHATTPSTTDAEADLSSFDADGYTLNWSTVASATAREFVSLAMGGALQSLLPDADVTTTGWTTAPLYSKLNDSSDATIITATAS